MQLKGKSAHRCHEVTTLVIYGSLLYCDDSLLGKAHSNVCPDSPPFARKLRSLAIVECDLWHRKPVPGESLPLMPDLRHAAWQLSADALSGVMTQ